MAIGSVAIVGTGAVGGYYGARLVQGGFDVHFLMRSDYAAVRERGLSISSCDGDFVLGPERMRVYDRAEGMPAVDLVIVTLKTTSNDQFEALIGPLLKSGTAILTLQNGLGNEERLAELFGAERVLGGLAFTCINRTGPGRICHLDHGLIRLGEFGGEFGGGPSARVSGIAEAFGRCKIRCDVLGDLRQGRWEKLVWNVPFNGLGAAMDLTTDRLIANEAGTTMVRRLMEEVIRTAGAVGVKLSMDLIQRKIDQTRTMGAYHTSMQIDRQLGRPIEVESIIGKPLELARKNELLTPWLEWVYQMLGVLKCEQS